MSSAAEQQRIAWDRFKRDPVFAAKFWTIKHPKGARPWDLYPAQEEILDSWGSGDNHIHLKARQIGFSTTVGFFAFWMAVTRPESSILLLSRGEREAQELLEKVKFGLDRLTPFVQAKVPTVSVRTLSKIAFSNGSEILSLPSASDPARGYTGSLVVVDEWAFLPNPEESWASIQPVADIGGQIIGLSTANGMGNFFHTLWERATHGDSTFIPMFYPWNAVPVRDQDWYERQQKDLLGWQLHQEYPTTPEEAFIKSGATVFSPDDIRLLKTRPPKRYRIQENWTKSPGIRRHDDGELSIWKLPEENGVYVVGADPAEGLIHGDFSSAHVLDATDGSLCATWHGRIAADIFGEILHNIGILYNEALVCVEANNHGLTTLTALRRPGYPRIYKQRQHNRVTNSNPTEYGFKTSRASKPLLIDDLGAYLRENPDMPCEETIRELITYVRDSRGQMSGSPHDDRVISLALAVHMLQFAYIPEYKQEVDDTGTLDWWARHLDVEPPADYLGTPVQPFGRTRLS